MFAKQGLTDSEDRDTSIVKSGIKAAKRNIEILAVALVSHYGHTYKNAFAEVSKQQFNLLEKYEGRDFVNRIFFQYPNIFKSR